ARTVAASLPETGAEGILSSLRDRDDVTELRVDADRLTLRAADSDAVAAALLAAGAHDLEITAPTLETAFTALTED
ncbi:MAG TPA: ABC transporter ATP-binding protein, partial [Microbacterium sp.]|nr:ABC transporter ATP-binding protein [Microbacterium sp.]